MARFFLSVYLQMGYTKHIVIESMVFSVSKVGNYFSIIEKSWKVMNELRLSLYMVQWFSKFLEDCLKRNVKDFYSTVKEGNCSFIAQRCSNASGRYMTLVEYGGGNRHNFIFILEDKKG